MKLRTFALPAVIAVSGAFLAACGDPDEDLSPEPGMNDDTGIVEPTLAPETEPTYEDPMDEPTDDPLDEDADA